MMEEKRGLIGRNTLLMSARLEESSKGFSNSKMLMTETESAELHVEVLPGWAHWF